MATLTSRQKERNTGNQDDRLCFGLTKFSVLLEHPDRKWEQDLLIVSTEKKLRLVLEASHQKQCLRFYKRMLSPRQLPRQPCSIRGRPGISFGADNAI